MFVFDVYQTERQNSRSGVSIEIEQQRPAGCSSCRGTIQTALAGLYSPPWRAVVRRALVRDTPSSRSRCIKSRRRGSILQGFIKAPAVLQSPARCGIRIFRSAARRNVSYGKICRQSTGHASWNRLKRSIKRELLMATP